MGEFSLVMDESDFTAEAEAEAEAEAGHPPPQQQPLRQFQHQRQHQHQHQQLDITFWGLSSPCSSVRSSNGSASFAFETCRSESSNNCGKNRRSSSAVCSSVFLLPGDSISSSCSCSSLGLVMPSSSSTTEPVNKSSMLMRLQVPPAPPQSHKKKSVRFWDEAPEDQSTFDLQQELQLQERMRTKSHYATPSCAKMVVKNGSLRRFSNDEVELFFSQDLDQEMVLPVSKNDFALQQLVKRTNMTSVMPVPPVTKLTTKAQQRAVQNHHSKSSRAQVSNHQTIQQELFLCGIMQIQDKHKLFGSWQNCYGELFHGILFLAKWKRCVSKQQNPRIVLPIDCCSLRLVDLDQSVLEIECSFQNQSSTTRLRFGSADTMFLWYFSIQLMTKTHLVTNRPTSIHNCRSFNTKQLLESFSSVVESLPITSCPQVGHLVLDRKKPKQRQPLGRQQLFQSALQKSQQALEFLKKEFDSNARQQHFIFPRTYVQQQRLLQQQRLGREKALRFGAEYPSDPLEQGKGRSVTHLILIRHGEAENIHFRVNDKEKKLTMRGRRQAFTTARWLARYLRQQMASGANVKLVYGNLRRVVETAQRFFEEMPFLTKENFFDCCFITEGAPKEVDQDHRLAYRDAMHRLAFELVCQYEQPEPVDPLPSPLPSPSTASSGSPQEENYRIVICHASFIQFVLAQCYQVSKAFIQLGAPIGHCAMTQIDLFQDDQRRVSFMNRISHLSPMDRTTD